VLDGDLSFWASQIREYLMQLTDLASEDTWTWYNLAYSPFPPEDMMRAVAIDLSDTADRRAHALDGLTWAWATFANILLARAAAAADIPPPYDFAAWDRDFAGATGAQPEAFGEHVLTLLDVMIGANK